MKKLLAVALLVITVAAACGDDDDEATPTTESTTSTTATPPQSTTTAPDAAVLVDPAETARAWIAAIADGADDDAIALTSARSLAAIGGPDGFHEREIELAEGWGAWDFAEELEVSAVAIDDTTSLVILHGEVPQEGPPDESWAALPVIATEDGDRVDPFIDLGNVEVDPPMNTTIPASTRFTAFVLGGRDVVFVVDDGQPVEPALEGFDGDQQRGELDVDDLAPGLHSLTVVLSNDDGVMARTFHYRVE